MFQLVCVCVRAYVYTLCTDTNVYTHAQWYFSNQTSFNRIMFSDAQWFCFKANQEQDCSVGAALATQCEEIVLALAVI